MKMVGSKTLVVSLFIISVTASLAAKVQHVVGGDHGWGPSSDLASWSNHRTFRVGDEIWFAYSAAQGLVAELKSKEEYESCNVSNPIRMYADGLHQISLEREGTRYFASSDPVNCHSGLKLHVEVQPMANSSFNTPKTLEADGPSSPSGSAHFGGSHVLMFIAMFWVAVGLAY
ncbi:hypothetical protein L6164_032290 [Bauhinia variegata]|uniref:Uncharacterized protein n=1 Tax=Bauhinia variegata TaxID=167791 RepID=A0ACB9KNB3_BAUVA|nr:hypothetical protein L6164_032290 [Bauhinia variegata]